MYKKGMVSCIIPTYKRNDTLPRAIESVLNQTYKNVEILIIDDNEPGDEYFLNNKELLKRYCNISSIRHITQEHHTNGAVARNMGIKSACGEFIAFLDDDDYWLPEKIEKQVAYLNDHPDCGGVTCLYNIIMNGDVIGRCSPYSADNLQEKVLLRSVAICTPTFCGRTDSVINSRGFDPSLKRHQDIQFYIDFLNISSIYPINEVLLVIYADSTINRPNTEKQIENKKLFFDSIRDTLLKYDGTFRKRVYNAHYFEIILSAVREKKIMVIIKYLFKIGVSPHSYIDLYKRYKLRK